MESNFFSLLKFLYFERIYFCDSISLIGLYTGLVMKNQTKKIQKTETGKPTTISEELSAFPSC